MNDKPSRLKQLNACSSSFGRPLGHPTGTIVAKLIHTAARILSGIVDRVSSVSDCLMVSARLQITFADSVSPVFPVSSFVDAPKKSAIA